MKKDELVLRGNDICSEEEFHSNGHKRNSVGISSASYSNIVAIIHGNLELPAPKAYAKELIRRWNSQPKLLEACNYANTEIIAATEIPTDKRLEKDKDNLIYVIRDMLARANKAQQKLKVAIAEAEGS